MQSSLDINGNKLYPIKELAGEFSYSRDYITRLAREKKIVAAYIGRQWFVSKDSLQAYVDSAAAEQEIRKKHLSIERKLEKKVAEKFSKQNSLRQKHSQSLRKKALVTAVFVLGFGLLGGFQAYNFLSAEPQLAQVSNELNTTTLFPEEVLSVVEEAELEAEFSYEVESLGDVSEGILLLPAAQGEDLENIFSDKVAVRKTENGSEIILLVDESGRVVEKSIPFVTLPVQQNEI